MIADDLIARQVQLLRLSAGERAKVYAILKRMEEELVDRLTLDRKLTDLSREDKARLLRQAQEVIAQYYGEVSDEVGQTLAEVGSLEASATAVSLGGMIAAEFEPSLPPEGVMARIVDNTLIDGAPSAAWWKRQSGDLQFRFANAVRQGLMAGETNDEIIRRIRGRAHGYTMVEGKRVYNFVGGIMDIARHHAAAQVQTSVMSVANRARMDTFEANDDIIKGYRQLSTLDSHTTPICVAYSGAEWDKAKNPINGNKLPFVSPKGAPTGTPRHWNAVARGEMVTTASGPKPIELVAVGEMVLTHRGRFRPVVAVMRKSNDTGIMRVIRLESGRTIRVTDEHPVLAAATANGGGWLRADALKIGDKLFQYNDEPVPVGIRFGVDERHPHDYPSLFDAGEVFARVLFGAGEVAASIKLDNHAASGEGKIPHATSDNRLTLVSDSKGIQPRAEKNFTKREIGKLIALRVLQDAAENIRQRARVALGHALGLVGVMRVRFLGQSVSPMLLTAQLSGGVRRLHRHTRGRAPITNRDAVAAAPAIEDTGADAVLPFNLTNGLVARKVLALDEVENSLLVSQVDHFSSNIVSDIRTVAHNDDVYNIAVDEDESYLVGGVIVHNCRSVIVPVTKTFRELGLDVDEVPGATRAASGGPVAANETFDGYLKRRGDKFADELLGPGRAQLWREGKITLPQLLDQSGRPLTLKQLRRLYER